ncbi:MAG: hypothetical protein AMXMBFR64_59850 [Myxococcales bacterium]
MRSALGALVLLWTGVAHAFSVSLSQGNVIRWKKPAVTYALHPAGSADISDGSDLQAVRAAFKQWQDVTCTTISFTEKPGSTNLALTALGYGTNGVNEVAWVETSAWVYGSYVLGVTSPVFYTDGSIIEADIALNGYQQKWSTKGGGADVASTVLHEQGHFIGLQHVLYGFSAQDPPTMAPTVDPGGKTATLHADDKAGVCYLYPKTAGCATDADCPYVVDDGPQGEVYAGKMKCSGGLCGGMSNQLPEGTQGLGESCSSEYDCKDDGAFCQIQGASGGTCAVECASPAANDCPAGLECIGWSNAPGGVCLPKSGGGATKADGAPCSYGNECQSLLCVGDGLTGTCRKKCAPGNDAACGAGMVCAKLQGQSYGACVEGDGPALKGAGEPCDGGQECASGLCVGLTSVAYACADACVGGACTEGFGCVDLVGGGGACLPVGELGELGATCEYNTDCKSDVCIKVTGPQAPPDPFCTQECGECPCGMECVEFVGGESFCRPAKKVGCVATGLPCAADGECVGGVCDGGLCAQACSVMAPACPAGEACRPLAGTAGVCDRPGGGAPGGACTDNDDCSTLFCGQLEGTGVCLVPCDPAQPLCGDAFVCEPAGALGGCVAAPEVVDAGGSDDVGQGDTTGDVTTSVDASTGADAPGPSGGGGPGGAPGGGSGAGSGCRASPTGGAGALVWALLLLLAWRSRLPKLRG